MARKPKHFKLKGTNYNIFQPEVKQTKLDNQILVITEKIPYFNSFALGIGVRAGSRDDFVGKEGISHFLEHCVFRRTKNYESKQINELFEKYGAYANAFTTKEYTTYYVRALNDNFEKVWNLMKEIVFEPKFDKKDISKEKSIVKEEVRSYTEDPEEEIFDITDKYLFRHSRLSHPIVGTIHSLSNIGIEDLINFYERHYLPSQIVISYVGGFTHDVIVDFVNRNTNTSFLKAEHHVRDKISFKPMTFHKKLKRQFLQTHISIAKVLPNLPTRERYICALANLLLGDCSSSRLYRCLREKSGLVYNVFSIFTSYSDCSAVYIYSTTNPSKSSKTVDRTYNELETLHKFGFSESELILAKEQIKSSTIMALENYSERLQGIIKSKLVFGEYESLPETISTIDSISLDELNNFIQKYFEPNSWSSIVFEPK